ncbi:hypothetical protein [Kineococcus terrestris]|uniref:hypothetical protein n=1 Tax=Kineococcus terrestris TaxID=2044856 RepID=UPI0034DB5A3C
MSTGPCGTLDLLEVLATPTTAPTTGTRPPRAPHRPADTVDDVAAVCALVNGNPLHANDRREVVSAILAEAAAHGGAVDPNGVRARLAVTNADGSTDYRVYPRVIGATYQALCTAGVLEFTGWIPNTDARGRNSGKQARSYRLTRQPSRQETPTR